MKSTTYGRGARGVATKLHSQLVRARGRCEACGSNQNLQTAHIISRRYSATRTDLDNAFCLCATCHWRFTGHPDEWLAFVDNQIGMLRYLELKERALSSQKVDWDAEVERLRGVLKAAS